MTGMFTDDKLRFRTVKAAVERAIVEDTQESRDIADLVEANAGRFTDGERAELAAIIDRPADRIGLANLPHWRNALWRLRNVIHTPHKGLAGSTDVIQSLTDAAVRQDAALSDALWAA